MLRRRQQGHGPDPRLFTRFLQEVGVGLRLRESLSQQGFSVVAGASHEIRSLKPRS